MRNEVLEDLEKRRQESSQWTLRDSLPRNVYLINAKQVINAVAYEIYMTAINVELEAAGLIDEAFERNVNTLHPSDMERIAHIYLQFLKKFNANIVQRTDILQKIRHDILSNALALQVIFRQGWGPVDMDMRKFLTDFVSFPQIHWQYVESQSIDRPDLWRCLTNSET